MLTSMLGLTKLAGLGKAPSTVVFNSIDPVCV